MPRLTINGTLCEVKDGLTVLEAARDLGIVIPTLCHLQGEKPFTSCMICVVKDCAAGRFLPSCAAPATEGLVIETDSEEVRQERTKILELLLSEHVGDCEAPCTVTCPARMDIPLMIRQIAAGQMDEAYETVTEKIALPAVLGRICPAPCEKACRRGKQDKPVSICLLKRFVADENRSESSHQRRLGETPRPTENTAISSGGAKPPAEPVILCKRVAIIGAGPAGLAAAFHLARAGHVCTVFDEHAEPGGALRYQVPRDKLPLDVLDEEIDRIRKLGVVFQMNTRIEPGPGVPQLKADYDAIVLAPGQIPEGQSAAWPIETDARGVKVAPHSFRTSDPAVFAGGEIVHAGHMAVRAVAHGKSIAMAIDQWLCGRPVRGSEKPFESRIGQLKEGELLELMKGADSGTRIEPQGGVVAGYLVAEAVCESQRCLQCDCRKAKACHLRELADKYGASQKTFSVSARSPFRRTSASRVVYEPGKCIKCGLCVRLSGLTFLGRGFDTVVGVPFGDSLESALGPAAADCVRECPTGALAWKVSAQSRGSRLTVA